MCIKKKLVLARRISQASFLILFIYILWSTTYPLQGSISPAVLFNLNSLLIFTVALSERVMLAGVAYAAAALIIAMIFGRYFCGWMCPLGAMIDAAGCLRKDKNIPVNVSPYPKCLLP